MKIVMPLFRFNLEGVEEYSFGNTGLSISRFDNNNIPEIVLFSEQDLYHIKNEAIWSLNYNSSEDSNYTKSNNPNHRIQTNTLLLAFKIFSEKRYPFIKYRLSSDHSLCRRLNEMVTFNNSHPRCQQSFNQGDLNCIKNGFLSLIEMDKISIRTQNAIYFLSRAWHNGHWMDSFILMMCSLESLFSKDKSGSATATITTRISSLLNSKPKCSRDDIGELYNHRSRIMHGNIQARNDAAENLSILHHLDTVTVECFKALINQKLYKEYSTKSSRDRLMSTLNTIS